MLFITPNSGRHSVKVMGSSQNFSNHQIYTIVQNPAAIIIFHGIRKVVSRKAWILQVCPSLSRPMNLQKVPRISLAAELQNHQRKNQENDPQKFPLTSQAVKLQN